jgi:broad specificity phosphatase PhoE
MESDGEVAERLFRELTLIAKKHPGQTILVGSHGTAIRIILMQLLNKHYREMPEQSFHNGGFVKLLYEQDKFVIEEVNGYNEPL